VTFYLTVEMPGEQQKHRAAVYYTLDHATEAAANLYRLIARTGAPIISVRVMQGAKEVAKATGGDNG
jgi:hypothetical protein